jgi:hypothetical protein
MKQKFYIILLSTLITFNLDLNAQNLNEEESELLNQHFASERGDFDFTGKQVCFFLAGAQWNKEEFFKDLIERNATNQSMSNQFILLSEKQKEKSGGYDVFIYSWSKVLITDEKVESNIAEIEKKIRQQK